MAEKKGFTLIELLISIVIFSFIIAAATYSFRLNIGIVRKIIMPYPQEAVKFSYLEDAVRSIFYFVGERKNMLNKTAFFTYFYGNDKQMRFITSKPIGFEGIALCRLYLHNNTLFLDESPVYSKYNNYKEPKLTPKDKKQVILMQNVSKIRIKYFIKDKQVYSLNEKIPNLVKIELTSNDKNRVFYFSIMSNFEVKKYLTRAFYAPQ